MVYKTGVSCVTDRMHVETFRKSLVRTMLLLAHFCNLTICIAVAICSMHHFRLKIHFLWGGARTAPPHTIPPLERGISLPIPYHCPATLPKILLPSLEVLIISQCTVKLQFYIQGMGFETQCRSHSKQFIYASTTIEANSCIIKNIYITFYTYSHC